MRRGHANRVPVAAVEAVATVLAAAVEVDVPAAVEAVAALGAIGGASRAGNRVPDSRALRACTSQSSEAAFHSSKCRSGSKK